MINSITCSVDICGMVLAKPVPLFAPRGRAVVRFASERPCLLLNHDTEELFNISIAGTSHYASWQNFAPSIRRHRVTKEQRVIDCVREE